MTDVQKIKEHVKYIALHLSEYENVDELEDILFEYYNKLPVTGDGRIVRTMILAIYNLACQVTII